MTYKNFTFTENDEIDNLQNISWKDRCCNPSEAAKSETAIRLVEIIDLKTNNWYNIDNKIDISDIYKRITLKIPITITEKLELIVFLTDDSNKLIAQKIFSKLSFLQWDNNSNFYSKFLKNSDKKLDITNFIYYLIKEVNNYDLVFDIQN